MGKSCIQDLMTGPLVSALETDGHFVSYGLADAITVADAVVALLNAARRVKDACNRPSAARTRAQAWRALDKALKPFEPRA